MNGNLWVGGYSQVFPIAARSGIEGTGITVGLVRDLAFGAGSLWVVSGLETGQQGVRDGAAARRRPSRVIRTTIALGTNPVAVEVADGSVWLASGKTIRRVDPENDQVIEAIPVGATPRIWRAMSTASGLPSNSSYLEADGRIVRMVDGMRLDAAHALRDEEPRRPFEHRRPGRLVAHDVRLELGERPQARRAEQPVGGRHPPVIRWIVEVGGVRVAGGLPGVRALRNRSMRLAGSG